MWGDVSGELPPKRARRVTESNNVRLPVDLWDRLTEIAKAEGYSRNELIEGILSDWLKDFAAKSARTDHAHRRERQ